jgi:Carboxypeptidase regulatory-like domain
VRNALLRLAFILLFPTIAATSAQSPERFDSGPYKGFTRSPTEHILDPIRTPIKVRSIRGVIKNPGGEPLPEVIIEIRDGTGNVRGVQTNERGEFRMPNVAIGKYDFKFTKNGFQSIVGTIEVSKSAPRKSRIVLEMEVGV